MRWLFYILGVLILLPVALIAFLFTPWGLNAAAGLATRFVDGLEIEGVSGPLPGRLAVARLAMRDAQGAWVEVEDARIELAWRELLDRRVSLTAVAAKRIALHRLPPSEPSPPAAEPTRIEIPALPDLPVAIRIDALQLDRIELGEALAGQAAVLSLAGAARYEARRLETQLVANRLDRPGEMRVNVALHEQSLMAEVHASEPPQGLVATLAGQPAAPFQVAMSMNGPASGADWTLRAALGETSADVHGRLSVSPEGAAALTLDGMVQPGPFVPEAQRALADRVVPSLAVRRAADGAIAVEHFRVELPAGRLESSGSLSAAQEVAARFRLDPAPPATFAALLPPGLSWTALTAEGEVGGTVAVPALDLRLQARGLTGAGAADEMLGESVTFTASLRGAERRVEATVEAERLKATVSGPAASPFDLAFTLEARDAPQTEGTILAAGRLTGTADDPRLEARIRTDRLAAAGHVVEAMSLNARASLQAVTADAEGQVDAKPLRIALRAARHGENGVRLEELRGSWSGLGFEGHGEGALPQGPVTGELKLDAPDLAPLGAGLAGSLRAQLSAWAVEGQTGRAAQGVRLSLDGTGVGIGANRAAVQARLEGTLAALGFDMRLTAPQYGLDLAGRVGQEAPQTVITMTRLEARALQDALRLAAPARILVSDAGELTLEQARLNSRRGGSLQLQGRLVGGQLNGRADIQAVPLAPLSGGFVTGTVSGQVTAAGPSAAPQVDATLRVAGLRATDPSLASIPAAQVAATARMQGTSFRAQAQVTAGPAVQLNLEAAQANGLGPAAPFTAAVRGRLDLGQLARPFLAGGADRFAGRATLDLRASGTVAEPSLAGTVMISDASYANPLYGLRIDAIAARLSAQGQRLVVDSFSGRTVGGGTISAQGWVEPLGTGIPAELRLTASRARPVTGETGDATIDADIALRGPLTEGGSLSGRIDIRRAELRIPENLGGSVPSLGQVREVGPFPPGRSPPAPPRPARAAPPSVPMALNLTISAPRAVFLRGRGIEAELAGDITIGGTVAAPVPSGGLRMRRGSFDLAGRQLNFTRGNIGFDAGTFMPTLDFLATARARTHTINVTVTGTPAAPELKVTSDPELPQDDALARLFFDRETSNLSPFQLATIAQAVAQLAGVGPSGPGVLDRLRSAAGLDRLGVGSDSSGGAAVEAGRYVAPGVYVGVRQGTSGGTPGVGVQVELTPSIRLDAETATGPGGDRVGVTWQFEY
ncbi:translocation/assembly module TamB domain-containing protein [Roseococcus sp. YIM B11640]|uniref:translocation/assembly module TamB domain-containing protein n=1 Tax=Roseococcus sp. YIM B11640 TaxID=3133973 RepID=UPI003C7ED5BF